MSKPVSSAAYETEPLEESDVTSGFRCGSHALDDYFARHALGNDRAGLGKTFVLRSTQHECDSTRVIGFYTLAMATVDASTVSNLVSRRLPSYPMPVALLARLAVRSDEHGTGVGARLLRDAIRRVHDVAHFIGCLGVVVDAKDERAQGFYSHFGFASVGTPAWPQKMFLSMATLDSAAGKGASWTGS